MFAKGLALGLACALASAAVAEDINLLLGDLDEPAVVEECGLLEDLPLNLGDRLRNRDPFWYAGGEITFLDVEASSGGRINLSFDDSGTAGVDVSFADGNGIDSTGYAPRFWLGRQFGENWGIVGRYWRLNDATTKRPDSAVNSANLPTFGTYTETDKIEAYTADLEGVRSFRPGKWKVDAMCGARHVSITTDSTIHSFGVITTGNFANLLLANGMQFEGTGPTVGLTGRRRLGETPVFFFISGRFSDIQGFSDSFGRAAGAVASSPSAPLVGAATVTRNHADARMEIFETQVGLDVEHKLVCCPASVFFRSAFEYQYWDLNGRPTGGAGFGGTIGTLTTNSFSAAGLGDLKLLGLSLSTGLTW